MLVDMIKKATEEFGKKRRKDNLNRNLMVECVLAAS